MEVRELENKLIELKWEKDRLDKAIKMYKNMQRVSYIENVDVLDFDIDLIKKSMMTKKKGKYFTSSQGYMKLTLNIIKELYKILNPNIDYSRALNFEEYKDLMSKDVDGFYNIFEIKDIIDILMNPGDKLIIYGLFMGIKAEELLTLKKSNIDFENKLIKTETSVIKMDEIMQEIIEDLADEIFCNAYYTNKNMGFEHKSKDVHKLERRNPYLIKPIPSKKNDGGFEAMTEDGLRSRLARLSKFTECKLLRNKIYRSGIMHKMRLIKKEWTPSELSAFLKVSGISAQVQELLRVYNLKYNIK